MEHIDQQIASLEKEGMIYEPWGDLPDEQIGGLQRAGWDLRFFTVPDRKYLPEWEDKYNAFVINQDKGQKYFVTVLPREVEEYPEADVVSFPQMSAEQIRQQVAGLKTEKETVAENLKKIAAFSVEYLKDLKVRICEDTDTLKVKDAAMTLLEDKVIALEGWVPEAIAADTDHWLADKGVAYELEIPTEQDNPPILLKNNKFARLFEFIGELYSLPNYREIDLTPFFCTVFCAVFRFLSGRCRIWIAAVVGYHHL